MFKVSVFFFSGSFYLKGPWRATWMNAYSTLGASRPSLPKDPWFRVTSGFISSATSQSKTFRTADPVFSDVHRIVSRSTSGSVICAIGA